MMSPTGVKQGWLAPDCTFYVATAPAGSRSRWRGWRHGDRSVYDLILMFAAAARLETPFGQRSCAARVRFIMGNRKRSRSPGRVLVCRRRRGGQHLFRAVRIVLGVDRHRHRGPGQADLRNRRGAVRRGRPARRDSAHTRSPRPLRICARAGTGLGLSGLSPSGRAGFRDPRNLATVARYANPLDRGIILPIMRLFPRQRIEAMMEQESLKDVVRTFEPGAAPPGLPAWTSIATLGHSPGHTVFLGMMIAC